jgi:membrane protein required for colicin V production
MASTDVVLLVVLIASMVLGFWRGLVFEVLSLAGWIAAFWVAQWYAVTASTYLPLADTAEPLRYAAGFAVVFVATAFAAGLLSWLVRMGIEHVGLRPVDRTLGAAFGVLRGVLLLLAAALLVHMTPFKDEEAWRQSVGAGWLHQGLHSLKGMMPEGIAEYFP